MIGQYEPRSGRSEVVLYVESMCCSITEGELHWFEKGRWICGCPGPEENDED